MAAAAALAGTAVAMGTVVPLGICHYPITVAAAAVVVELGAADFVRILFDRSSGFPTRSETNRAVQPQKIARDLKFLIQIEEGSHYPDPVGDFDQIRNKPSCKSTEESWRIGISVGVYCLRSKNKGAFSFTYAGFLVTRLIHSMTITRPCNEHPLTPHLYIVKLGFTGLYFFFLIFALKHRLWVLVRTASLRRF